MPYKRLQRSLISVAILIAAFVLYYAANWYMDYRADAQERARQQAAIEQVLSDRKDSAAGENTDPFGEDGIVRVLFIGLDSRTGEEHGHCDAIQLIEADRDRGQVTITAVPRGTYSPLPYGTGTTSSDYYVSNSCALGGLDYGIQNIERILGKKADFIAVVGFSETLGILRHIDLPTTETLQWLRNRQGYAIGEPQRARNHSTFLKQSLVRFIPENTSRVDSALHYLLYNKVQTDLSFSQTEQIIAALVDMDLANEPDKIFLTMKPHYQVQDIAYDPEQVDQHLADTVGRISGWLSPDDYAGKSTEDVQTLLLQTINESKGDPAFIAWAFEHDLWLQIEDKELREDTRWDLLQGYLDELTEQEQKDILADYILEMQHLGEEMRAETARQLLLKRFSL